MATAAETLGARTADPMVPARFRVAAKRPDTEDTWTLDLEPVDSDEALRFSPGQFNMVYAFAVGEVPISISGDPHRPAPLVHTVRAVGRATEAICAAEPGDLLGVRGPYGSAWPVEQAYGRDAVVIAGGVGLAPLRPVVYTLLSQRERFRRAILLYGGRSPELLLYADELRDWENEGALEVGVTVDTATRDWSGRVGVVPSLIERVDLDSERTVAFVCGPEVMMQFSARSLFERGVAHEAVHVSLERNMKCAVGHCGHCQFGPTFVCRDGPVFSYATMERFLRVREM